MATRIWSGATSGDMTVAGNYVGGVAPIANDDVIFDRGSVSVTKWAGVNLVTVTTTQGYTGGLGASGSAVAVDGNITTLKIGGKQSGVFLSVNTGQTIGTLSLETGSASFSGLGTITDAYVSGGANLNATLTTLTNLYVITPDSSAIIGTSATDTTTLYSMGRVESTSRNITNITVGPQGRVVTKGTTATSTIVIEPTGVFNKQSGSTDALATIKFGGTFSNEGNTYVSPAPTLSSAKIWSNGKIIPNGAGSILTVSATAYFGAAGGDRPFDPIG